MARITQVRYFDNELDRQDALTDFAILGWRVDGNEAYPPHRGKLWIYVVLGLMTYGLGAVAYWLYCRFHRANGVHCKVSRYADGDGGLAVPDWVRDAYEKHRRLGTPGYE